MRKLTLICFASERLASPCQLPHRQCSLFTSVSFTERTDGQQCLWGPQFYRDTALSYHTMITRRQLFTWWRKLSFSNSFRATMPMLWKKTHFALHFIASTFFSFPYCHDNNRDVITAPIKPRAAPIMKPLFIFQYNKHLSRFEIPLLKMEYYYLLSLVFYIQKFSQAFQNRRTDGSTNNVPEMSE